MKLDPEAQRDFAVDAVKQLRAAGYQALWAGGCVRDQLLGLTPKDYDVATDATPAQIRQVFGKSRTIPTGAAFGVVTVLGPSKAAGQVEVATFRQDTSYSDGRRPDAVIFTTPQNDALRRDFTINGLFYDPLSKSVIDYVNGQADIENRVVRAIGVPAERFAEDKLRMLRAVRFAAALEFSLDAPTAVAIRSMATMISVVSVERIAAEMRSMLTGVRRTRALIILEECHLLKCVLPELSQQSDDERATTLSELERLEQPSFALALAVLLHRLLDAPGMMALGTRWKLANRDLLRAAWLVENKQALAGASQQSWPSMQRLLIHPGAHELIAMQIAIGTIAPADVKFCEEKLALPPEVLNPPPLINGNDLQSHGIPPGKEYSRLLELVRDAQLDGRIHSRRAALELADSLRGG